MASRYCCFASRYWRIAGVADVDIFCSLTHACAGARHDDARRKRGARRRTIASSRSAAATPRARTPSGCRASSLALRRRARIVRRRRSICSRSRRAPDRSPACGSASRRSRGWRSRTGRRIVGVSALEALAHERRAARAGTLVAAWMDAHRQRGVHGAVSRRPMPRRFRRSVWSKWKDRRVGDPAATLTRWSSQIRDAPRAVRRRRRGAVCGRHRPSPGRVSRLDAAATRRCWPAPSAGWRWRARERGDTVDPAACAAAVRAPARRRNRAGTKTDARGPSWS